MGVHVCGEVELLKDLLDMRLDGALGYDQALGDRAIRQALGQQREHFALARRVRALSVQTPRKPPSVSRAAAGYAQLERSKLVLSSCSALRVWWTTD
jgi:hypothetical protein